MIRRSRFAPALALVLVLGACGSGESSSPDDTTASTPVPTVPGVGNLPDTVPTPDVAAGVNTPDEVPVSVEISRPVDEDGAVLDSIAEQVQGNRLLVIGDSILASTSTRYGGELCAALTPLGWDVEVDAEPGRFVEFGNEVLTDRLSDDLPSDEDFDAAIVHLGSNYREDQEAYFEELSEILFRISPRPMVLMNVTEYRPAWAEVNEVIDELATLYDNVTVVDWEKVSSFPGVLSGDGLHPGNQGEAVLVDLLAVALGQVAQSEGECLPTSFSDDSAIGSGGGPSSGGSSSDFSTGSSNSNSSSSSGSSSSGSSSSSSSSGGSSSGGAATVEPTSPPETSPPQTSPPGTSPPQPSPPVTSPPVTSPPVTNPPATSAAASGG
ncbi:hypothetical protein [Ilumatobacter sp.]|uniref:hypothetical protein n=1 Tax=Ilumatobacter sp. TaxID=1967498 RepID=UPI003C64040F